MNFRAAICISFVVNFVFLHENAFAYNFIGYKWSNSDIPIKYSINPDGFDDCEIDAIKEAFEIWSSVKNSSLRFKYQGTTSETPKTGRRMEKPLWQR